MSSSTPPPFPGLEVGKVYGPPLIGLVIATFLSGVLFLQVTSFFARYPEERLWIKAFVIGLFMLDIAHLTSICHYVYHLLVSNFGNWLPAISTPIVPSFAIEIILNAFTTLTVQMFFLYRIYVLSRGKLWLAILPAIPCFVAMAFGTWDAVRTVTANRETSPDIFQKLSGVWLATTAATDLIIAAILSYYLRTLRTPMSNRMISRLLVYTINTGLLTSIVGFTDLAVVEYGIVTNQLYTVFNFPLGRIYSNSLMASLNARPSDADSRDPTQYISNGSHSASSRPGAIFRSIVIPRRHISTDRSTGADAYELGSGAEPGSDRASFEIRGGENVKDISLRPSQSIV